MKQIVLLRIATPVKNVYHANIVSFCIFKNPHPLFFWRSISFHSVSYQFNVNVFVCNKSFNRSKIKTLNSSHVFQWDLNTKLIFSETEKRSGSRIPCRRGRRPSRGTSTYDFVKISQKLHEIEKNLGRRGGTGTPPLDPPLENTILCTLCDFLCHSSVKP